MLTGLALFLGALAGGYLTEMNEFLLNSSNLDFLLNTNVASVVTSVDFASHVIIGQVVTVDTLRLAVIISLAVVAVGRFVTSLPFLSLKEMKTFPSNWGEITKQIKRKFERGPPI